MAIVPLELLAWGAFAIAVVLLLVILVPRAWQLLRADRPSEWLSKDAADEQAIADYYRPTVSRVVPFPTRRAS